MSLSMTAEKQGKWEYIPSKKEKDQGKRAKKVEMKKAEVREGLIDADPMSSAFAALDKWKTEKPQQDSGSDSDQPARENDKPRGNGVFSAEELANLSIGNGKAKPAPKQSKKPKVKKVKVSAREVGASIGVSDIQATLASLEQTYKSEDAAQCEMLADFLWKLFADAELPFNKMLVEQSPAKVADIPLQYMNSDARTIIKKWLKNRNPIALEQLARNLIIAVFDGLPEFSRSSKQAPIQPPKAKVGLLLLLSILLRSKPAVLVSLCPFLLAQGSAFSAPLRIPQTLWLLSQLLVAGQEGSLVGICVFCEVMLPQIVGHALVESKVEPARYTMMQRESAIKLISWAQSACEGVKPGTSTDITSLSGGSPTPAVPVSALETIVRSLYAGDLEFGEPSTAPKGAAPKMVRDALSTLLPRLRTVAFSGSPSGSFSSGEALVLALETAENSNGSFAGEGSRLVSEAACSVLSALAASDAAFGKWEEKHKKMIKGSCRVLQHLMCAQPDQLHALLAMEGGQPSKASQFFALMSALRQRHHLFLQSGKGWQGACAALSDEAACALSNAAGEAVARETPSSFWYRLSMVALLSAVTGAAIYAVAEPTHSREYASRVLPSDLVESTFDMIPPEVTSQLRNTLAGLSTRGQECIHFVTGSIPPEAMQKLQGALQGANRTVTAIAGTASEVVRDLVKQWSH